MAQIVSLIAIQVACWSLCVYSLERINPVSRNSFLWLLTACLGVFLALFGGYLFAGSLDRLLQESSFARSTVSTLASIFCAWLSGIASISLLKKLKLIS